MKTTNYHNTFISIAEDSKATKGIIPPFKENPTVARMQYDMIAGAPYRYTSDDVIFSVYADRNDIPESDRSATRKKFFSRGQACLRTSPLAKTYGWGIHHNNDGKVALAARETEDYENFAADAAIEQVKAMRSKRA